MDSGQEAGTSKPSLEKKVSVHYSASLSKHRADEAGSNGGEENNGRGRGKSKVSRGAAHKGTARESKYHGDSQLHREHMNDRTESGGGKNRDDFKRGSISDGFGRERGQFNQHSEYRGRGREGNASRRGNGHPDRGGHSDWGGQHLDRGGHPYQGGHQDQGGHPYRGGHQDQGGHPYRGGHPDRGGHTGPPGEGRNRTPYEVRPPYYKRLVEWTEKDPSEVIAIIANESNGFGLLLEGDLRPDIMILVVKVLAIACKADFEANKAAVLSNICRPNTKFLAKLNVHMSLMATDTDSKRKVAIKEFFEDLLVFCETVVNVLPSTACEYLGSTLTFVTVAMTNVTTFLGITFDEVYLLKVAHLQGKIKEHLEFRAKKQIKETSANEALKYQPPPDDFREISIFPTPADILTREKAFIRPNIVDGAYLDVDHYLDVQFRLLREDFVCPLREGITDFITMNNENRKKKINNIRIYKKVQFKLVRVVKDSVGLVVQFECNQKINWDHSKRFMFGSLLCFTNDNFETILFATVLDRNVSDLVQGRIVVELAHHNNIAHNMFDVDYVMVESEVFFAPYHHVLKALQLMNNQDFPMSRYIVDVQAHTTPPQYVLDHNEFPFTVDDFQIPVMADEAWPPAESLGLDESQYQAFRSALTKEFVVIQGPPGTGKTYLGLKIARTLLSSVDKLLEDLGNQQFTRLLQAPRDRLYLEAAAMNRRQTRRTPILVVCFTNHALDQFLEGLIDTTENIVRVGGQSSSDTLAKYNLKERRKERRFSGTNDSFRLWHDIRDRMSKMMAEIKGIQDDMEHLNLVNGVISIECIRKVYLNNNLKVFKDEYMKPGSGNATLLEWLEAGVMEEDYQQGPAPGLEDGLELPPPLLPDPKEGQEAEQDLRENERRQDAAGDDFELDRDVKSEMKVSYAMHLVDYYKRVSKIKNTLREVQQQESYANPWVLQEELHQLTYMIGYYKRQLHNPRRVPFGYANRLANQTTNLYELSPADRWLVYHHWLHLMRRANENDLRHLQTEYRRQARLFQEARDMDDLTLMKNAHVVGMTTTMAAKSQALLQALKPRIVIVEEAAEVMESHIVVSLTNHCQHLILIGDHQQLRPTTAVYKLARDFNFDISLFERMLRNGLHCEVLKVQHRMRPEIARLIVPSIYTQLINHESVMNFEPIRGVTKSVYFLSHEHNEQEVGETNSRRNSFEGDMLLAFCRHLLLQGYAPDRITILTTYSGQMFYLRTERKKYPILEGVQITIVDNYQGEENDIILLSLVRNNTDNIIGFLKTENRVCVALSRAKHGFFIMGNMGNLTASSTIWPKIKEALDEQNAVGDHLTLRCQVHPEQLTEVKTSEDFHKVPEGGCQLPCDSKLPCGHHCKSICHSNDREHKEYTCYEPCARVPLTCNLEHLCKKACFDECGNCPVMVERKLPCGHVKELACHIDHLTYECMQWVETTAVDCQHTYKKPCSRDDYPCTLPCMDRLDCGHACTKKCHVNDDPSHMDFKCQMDCTKKNAECSRAHMCQRKCHETCGKCMFEEKKTPTNCDHVYKVACHMRPEDMLCLRPCKKMLPCGHPCRQQCYEECGNCQEKVEKTIAECNHKVNVKCCEEAQRRHCRKACRRLMTCGHKCLRQCKVPCSSPEECMELMKSVVVPACGHAAPQVPCSFNAKGMKPDSTVLLSYCREQCSEELKCGHVCLGNCGTCIQGRIHQACKEKCGKVLICGHVCKEPCSESCPPCKEKCQYKCKHSNCPKDCGVPCTNCKMRCDWSCEHTRCTRLCGQVCNREPCYEPCKKMRPCNHPCIGFCGEPCPPLCRVCDEEEVTTILFGNEDEPDARFVYLVDCKHCCESQGLETWLRKRRNEVKLPVCPLCTTDIMRTLRFANEVRGVFKDVQTIKRKVFGEKKAIEDGRLEVVRMLLKIGAKAKAETRHQQMRDRQGRLVPLFPRPVAVVAKSTPLTDVGLELHGKLYGALQPQIQKRGKKIHHSWVDVETLGIQVNFFNEIHSAYEKVYPDLSTSTREILNAHTDLLLTTLGKRQRISIQEVEDFNIELGRYRRIAQFCQLDSMVMSMGAPTEAQLSCAAARNVLFTITKYTDTQDNFLKETFEKLKAYKLSEIDFRKQIVKAMGLKQGHWFKCPNGHFYTIGECGGAMQESKCPDCGVRIGGSSHRLRADNRVATEMDGAVMGAWDRGVAGARAFM